MSHPKLFFNNADVLQTNSQKHLGVVLNSKLTFHDFYDIAFTKVVKTTDVLRKLNSILPSAVLATIFKTFVRPHLGYGDDLTIKLLIVPFMMSWNQFSAMHV